MGWLYEKIARRALFALDSETAHERGVQAMALLGALAPLRLTLETTHRLLQIGRAHV